MSLTLRQILKEKKDKAKQIEEMAIEISGSTRLDTMAYYKALTKAKKCYEIAVPKDSVVLSKEELNTIQSNFFDSGIKHGSKETAEKIYRQLQGHGTTYVKKWIKEQFGVEIKELKGE